MDATELILKHGRRAGIPGILLVWAICLTGIQAVAASEISRPVSLDEKRSFVSEKLVDLGAEAEQAERSVAQLSESDVNVLYDNPDMIQAAGDLSEEEVIIIVFGAVICVLLIVIIL